MKTTTNDDGGILYLRRRDVEAVCREIDSVAVMRHVFELHGSNRTILPDEAYLAWTNERGESVRSLNMPAYLSLESGIAGTKIINSNPHNTARGLPRASGLTLLYDSTSTRILCIMEGAYLSSLRTASVTGLATELLKGPEIKCLAIIGAGVLAQAHITLLAERLPELRWLLVFDLEEERVNRLRRELGPSLEAKGVTFEAMPSAEAAIREAQLIVPATTTTTGYISFDWLQPGALLVNVSLDDPLPEVVLRADKVIVDDWNLVKNDSRRLIGRMYREGRVAGPDTLGEKAINGCRRIDAQLGEIVTGAKVGRSRMDEIILVNPFGLAIEDMGLAAQVYRMAKEKELGLWLER
jgi:ornithine cyclodeaminase